MQTPEPSAVAEPVVQTPVAEPKPVVQTPVVEPEPVVQTPEPEPVVQTPEPFAVAQTHSLDLENVMVDPLHLVEIGRASGAHLKNQVVGHPPNRQTHSIFWGACSLQLCRGFVAPNFGGLVAPNFVGGLQIVFLAPSPELSRGFLGGL